ncbi:hypothetical protein OAU50_00220 [Planctomycetota bacterium]|nr:hypothetical protein [Planctomycetota bacterium]
MASKSLLISLLAVFLISSSVWAEPKYKTLQADVVKLQTKLSEAENARLAAAKKVANNVRMQQKVSGDELGRLKREGVALARAENKAAKAVGTARTNMTNKQGEVRAAAAKFASSEIGKKVGNLAEHIREVIFATDAWSEAIGPLPDVPKVRDTSAIAEPEEKMAIIADDKKALKAFTKWADAETGRLTAELKLMDKLLKSENDVKDEDDGPLMIRESKALKKVLDDRKVEVANLKTTANSLLNALK